MKKLMLSWTLVLAVAGLTLMSCGKDKDDNKPNDPNVGTVKDERDQIVYKTIKIGNQTWFAENLKYNGALSSGSSFDPYGSQDSTAKYGKLYTLDAAKIACPNGWHLPTDENWRLLEHNLGMSNLDTTKTGDGIERGADAAVGIKLQKGGTSGFDIVVKPSESEEEVWTASSNSNGKIYTRIFKKNDGSVYRYLNGSGATICVRCLKD